MILATHVKQPQEVKDYDIDYAPWLLPVNDTLDQIDLDITCLTDSGDDSLICTDSSITDTTCKLWLSGGTDGQRYKITVWAHTVGGRIDESELVFKVKDY